MELSDGVAMVRQQLIAAQRAQGTVDGRVLGFVMGKASLEFSGEVRRAAGVGGDVKFWVFTENAMAERIAEISQEVVVELIPQARAGHDRSGGATENRSVVSLGSSTPTVSEGGLVH